METDVRIDCTSMTASISTPANNARGYECPETRKAPHSLPPKLRSTPVATPGRRRRRRRVPSVHPTAVVRDVG